MRFRGKAKAEAPIVRGEARVWLPQPIDEDAHTDMRVWNELPRRFDDVWTGNPDTDKYWSR